MSRPTDAQLLQSLKSVGCRWPVLITNGLIRDGARRVRLCQAHGISFEMRQVAFDDLPAALWRNGEHERALAVCGECSITDYAKRCEATLGDVARLLAITGKLKKRIRIRVRAPSIRRHESKVQFWISPRLRRAAEIEAERNNETFAEYIRRALIATLGCKYIPEPGRKAKQRSSTRTVTK